MTLLANHPEAADIRERLHRNIVLRRLQKNDFEALEADLAVVDYRKGDVLLSQGAHEMEQYFVLDGILKRVVASPEGKEMILRFAYEDDMDTSYAAWKLRTPAPYSIRAVTKARVAKLPLPQWAEFLDRRPELKEDFEYEVMHLMSEVMAPPSLCTCSTRPGACIDSCGSIRSFRSGCRRRSWRRISTCQRRLCRG
jgi:signal-transduction protein with cAMP-binding, CBS, and nucleotidyltransferase domain